MTKLDLLLFGVGFIALVTGSGVLSARRGRPSGMASGGRVAPTTDEAVLESRPGRYDTAMRMASVEVRDDRGIRLCAGSTPTSFRLKRVEKGSFNSIDYHVAVRTPQGYSQQVMLRAVPNGWYICGEFIFEPKVGWIAFAPEHGAFYRLPQSKVAAAGEDDPDPGEDNPNVSFVLVDDVPAELRKSLKRLNHS